MGPNMSKFLQTGKNGSSLCDNVLKLVNIGQIGKNGVKNGSKCVKWIKLSKHG